MTRAPMSKESSEKLRKLKQIPIDKVKGFSSIVVDQPIGELSLKNAQRVIYVLNSTLLQMEQHQKGLVDEFQRRENNVNKLIERYEKTDINNISIDDLLNDLKSINVIPKDESTKSIESTEQNSDSEKSI